MPEINIDLDKIFTVKNGVKFGLGLGFGLSFGRSAARATSKKIDVWVDKKIAEAKARTA